MTIRFSEAESGTTDGSAKINDRNAEIAFSLNVNKRGWCWAQFVGKASTRHSHFKVIDPDALATETTSMFKIIAGFLQHEQNTNAFHVSLNTNIRISVDGDENQYFVEFVRDQLLETEPIFCVIKKPFQAVLFESPNECIRWCMYDDTSRAFEPLLDDPLMDLEKELQASYYANMSTNMPIFSHCYLKRYYEMKCQQFMLKCTKSKDDDNHGIVMDLMRCQSSKMSSVFRVL